MFSPCPFCIWRNLMAWSFLWMTFERDNAPAPTMFCEEPLRSFDVFYRPDVVDEPRTYGF